MAPGPLKRTDNMTSNRQSANQTAYRAVFRGTWTIIANLEASALYVAEDWIVVQVAVDPLLRRDTASPVAVQISKDITAG